VPGTYQLYASWAGNANYNGATGNTINVTYVKANSSVSLACSPNPAGYGQSVGCIATVGGGANGETVDFLDGGTQIGTGTISGGVASFSTASLAVGTHSLTAEYVGDGTYDPSTSNTVSETINHPSTTTVVWSTLNPSPAGQAVQTYAEVLGNSPTGSVAFTVDGNAAGTPALGSVTTTNLLPYSNTFSSWSWTTGVTLTPNATTAPDGSNTAWLDQVGPSYYILDSGSCSAGPIVYSLFAKEAATNPATGFNISRRYFNSSGSMIGGVSFSPVSLSQNWQRYTVSAVAPAGTTSCETGIELPVGPSGAGVYLWGAQIENAASAGPYVPTGSSSASGTESIVSIPVAGLAPGNHSIMAAYSGNDVASTSPAYTQVVDTTNSTSLLTSSVNPSVFNRNVTFTTVISTGGWAPTGTVSFTSDGTSIGRGTVSSVPVTNLAPFSDDFTKWSTDAYLVAAPTLTPASANGPDGSASSASTISYPAANSGYSDLTLSVANGVAYANTTMTFSFWVQGPSGTSGLQPIITDAPYTGNAVAFGICNPIAAWARCSVTLTFPGNAGTGYTLRLRSTGTTTQAPSISGGPNLSGPPLPDLTWPLPALRRPDLEALPVSRPRRCW